MEVQKGSKPQPAALCCHITTSSYIWIQSHKPSTLQEDACQLAGIMGPAKTDLAGHTTGTLDISCQKINNNLMDW